MKKKSNSRVRTFFLVLLFQIISLPEYAQHRPNIIFLLADDLRYNSLGCKGNTIIQTPNMDMLADNGTLFNNAFVTTSIYCISRASIMSGQYANRKRPG